MTDSINYQRKITHQLLRYCVLQSMLIILIAIAFFRSAVDYALAGIGLFIMAEVFLHPEIVRVSRSEFTLERRFFFTLISSRTVIDLIHIQAIHYNRPEFGAVESASGDVALFPGKGEVISGIYQLVYDSQGTDRYLSVRLYAAEYARLAALVRRDEP